MKELSIKEKAKRYDEALEKAKNYHSPETVCNVRIAMENLFPELTESEDERVRKELISLVTWSTSYSASGVTKEDADRMTCWLERQGAQTTKEING